MRLRSICISLAASACSAEGVPPIDAESSTTAETSETTTADTRAEPTASTTDDETMGPGPSSDTETSDPTDDTTTGPECASDEECSDEATPFCDPLGACVSCNALSDPDAACAGADAAHPVCDSEDPKIERHDPLLADVPQIRRSGGFALFHAAAEDPHPSPTEGRPRDPALRSWALDMDGSPDFFSYGYEPILTGNTVSWRV